jgi:rod shape-determining protein MreD
MGRIDRRPGIRPRASLGRRLDIAARAGFPACITVLLMLLTQAPLNITGQAALLPAVALCCVWFWSLFRPQGLPPPVVFLIGLLMDLLGYLPLGVGVFTLLAVHGVASALRDSLS